MERLLRVKDICAEYGLSTYEAQTIMNRVEKVNVGRGDLRPRWATTARAVDAYLDSRKDRNPVVVGLDRHGKLIRR